MATTPTLLLVDGNALFYRAFHAFPKDLTTPDGTPSGAAFGFTRILLATLRTLQPTHLAVCFDVSGGTFRDQLYANYKATRAKMPEELAVQVPYIWELVDRLEVPRYTAPGFEADDLIGTLARLASTAEPPWQVRIVSGDQDLIQLVTDHVFVYAPAIGFQKPTLYTPEKVSEKYGFTPAQMIDYKALRGDPSDNIPGIPGIGEVTAKQLLAEFQTLDNLYTQVQQGKADHLKPALLKKIQENEASARLSYSLATIHTTAPITFEPEPCRLRLDHPESLIALFQELGFRSLIRELPTSHRLVSEAADVFGVPDDAEIPLTVDPEPTSESTAFDQALAPILRTMEHTGVTVDKPYLATLEQEFERDITHYRDQLVTLAGEAFNPDSPQQVAHTFYETLGLPTDGVRKGKTGYTTDADTMEKLAHTYPIAALLLKYRELAKLQSTYVKPLQELTDEQSRIHTSYAPDTSTGRISSRNPNLQNIPARSEQGRRIRQAFIAPSGRQLVAADYSQIELRIAAHLSQDATMLEAFRSNRDFHAETAERMGVDRRVAKVINFSILYGKGAYGFSQDLGISMAEAREYIEHYFATFTGLRTYLDTILREAKEKGYVETLFGRRRFLPDLTSGNFQRRSAAEREALNLPIQGTAADILKKAMISLDASLRDHHLKACMILTVHDELVLEVPQSEVAETAPLVRAAMETTTQLSIPLPVDMKTGANWNELEPM